MDMVHCERQAKLALEESKGAMQLIHGELIMQSYFENLAVEVQEVLQVRHAPPCMAQVMHVLDLSNALQSGVSHHMNIDCEAVR